MEENQHFFFSQQTLKERRSVEDHHAEDKRAEHQLYCQKSGRVLHQQRTRPIDRQFWQNDHWGGGSTWSRGQRIESRPQLLFSLQGILKTLQTGTQIKGLKFRRQFDFCWRGQKHQRAVLGRTQPESEFRKSFEVENRGSEGNSQTKRELSDE